MLGARATTAAVTKSTQTEALELYFYFLINQHGVLITHGGVIMSMKVHILSKQINENEYVAFDPMSKTVLILNRQEKKYNRKVPKKYSAVYI